VSGAAPAGRAPAGRAPAAGRRSPAAGRDLALVAAAAAATVAVAVAATRRPLAALALLALLAAGGGVVLARARLARLDPGRPLTALFVSLPLLALLGPSFALPQAPNLFLFRLGIAAVVALGLPYWLSRRRPVAFAAGDLALPLALWAAWLALGAAWAADKPAAFRYLAVVATMLFALAGAAAAGGTRRRLVGFGWTMVAGYLFIAGFSLVEARLGVRLPTSRLLTAVTSQTWAVTSVFHNQNDLATYLALCWPFLLSAVVFTRRPRWLLPAAALFALGAYAFVRTGSRSSLVAAGLSALAAVALYWRGRPTTRAGKAAVAVAVALACLGGAWLLFNNSADPMLRQFRLESLLEQTRRQSGSGAIRSSLTERGLRIAGESLLLGAGPGQAERLVGSGLDALGITNLHNWWLETYADGGLPGFALHLAFYAGLLVATWRVARRDPDPLLRFLAGGTALALVGFVVGAVGPSSSVSFAPMWILYGLGLAVVSRARLAAREQEGSRGNGGRADAAGGARP